MQSLEGEGDWLAGEVDWRPVWMGCSERVGSGGEEGEEGEVFGFHCLHNGSY